MTTSLLQSIFQWLGFAQYNSSPPVAVDGQPIPIQADANGNILVSVLGAGGAGAGGYALPAVVNTILSSGPITYLPVNTTQGPISVEFPPHSYDGQLVFAGDVGGAALTNPWSLSDPNNLKVQNPQGPGLVFGNGSILTVYTGNEPGEWHCWLRVTDANPGGHGTFWAALF